MARAVAHLPLDRAWERRKTQRVNIERIRKKVTGGFRPFVIRTSDGREYSVPHPEFILLAPHSIAVVDEDGDIVTIDSLHITALKELRAKRK
jgi:hypothetical protein